MLPSDGTPLHPSGQEARRLLSHELSKPRYDDPRPLIVRLVEWVRDQIAQLLAHSIGGMPPVGLVLIVLAVVLVVALTVPRLRRRRVAADSDAGGVLLDEPASADALRARARDAAAHGAFESAVADLYRAIARSGEERALLREAPGSTAGEIARLLAPFFPGQEGPLHHAAGMFDRVCYGSARATAEDVQRMEELDRTLAAMRPVHHDDPSIRAGQTVGPTTGATR